MGILLLLCVLSGKQRNNNCFAILFPQKHYIHIQIQIQNCIAIKPTEM